MKYLIDNHLIFSIIFLGLIFILGFWADHNLYQYKCYGISSSNYEFEDSVSGNQVEYTVNFPLKTSFVDINGFMRRFFGQTEMNGIVKMKNGHLTEICDIYSTEKLQEKIRTISEYAKYCKSHDIDVIYVQPGYGISKWDNELPTGVTDLHNDILDTVLSELDSNDVSTIDLREEMHNDGISEYDMYYATDHHWNSEGGFYAYQKIAKKIQSDTNTMLDEGLLDIDNYQIDDYKNWHLGSRGQRTGILFAGADDYHLIYPKFESNIYNSEDGTTNSIQDVLIDYDTFKSRDVTNRYTYDRAYTKSSINNLKSLDAKTNLSVLLLSDSYQHVIIPYLLLTYADFHVSTYCDMSAEILHKYQPDVVVILPYAGNIASDQYSIRFQKDVIEN